MKKANKKAIVRVKGNVCHEVNVPEDKDIGDLADVKKGGAIEEYVRLEIIAISGDDTTKPVRKHWLKRLLIGYLKYTFIGGLVFFANAWIIIGILAAFKLLK